MFGITKKDNIEIVVDTVERTGHLVRKTDRRWTKEILKWYLRECKRVKRKLQRK